MKELLAFLGAKTQSLVGQRFNLIKDPGTGSVIAQERLAFFAESFNSLRDDTDIPSYISDLESLKLTDRVVVLEASVGAAICLDVSHPREYSRAEEIMALVPEHFAALGLGAGHALANLRVAADITPALASHYLGWLAMDAYGMHAGYFHWFDCVNSMKIPLSLPPLAMEAYHQGLGRGIWFIANGSPKAVQQLIERFPVERRANLWRGVGLMTSFWGVKDELELKQFVKVSKKFRPYLQQGVAQGISMRTDMGEVVEETAGASNVICGASAPEIAHLAKMAMNRNTGSVFDSKAMLDWQDNLVAHFAERESK